MTFVSIGFLAAGLAAIIPVVLHMINRKTAKDMPFPTLRFLRISVEKTRRRRRVQDLFLLLLRVAALLLIALGLAGPTVTNLSNFWGGGSTAVAIVIDNSASMGAIDSDKPRFETAVGAAMEILDELESGDQIALFMACGPNFPEEGRLSRSTQRVREMLDEAKNAPDATAENESQARARQLLSQVTVSYEKADLALQIQEARKVLSQCDAANKQIYVISDMQELCWEGMASPESDGDAPAAAPVDEAEKQNDDDGRDIPVILVDCHRAPKPNVAITEVDVRAAAPIAGAPISATAELYNTAEVPQQRCLELYIDGTKSYASPAFNIKPGGRMKHNFQFTLERGGLHECEVRLVGEDGSRMDDRRFIAMEVDQGIPIAIVKEREHEIEYLNDSYYVEQALAPANTAGWAIRATQLTADELSSEPLSNFAVIYCVNLPAPDSDTAERLLRYVQRGGHLFWIAGENVDPIDYNAMNETADVSLLPAPLLDVRTPLPEEDRDSWHISDLDKSHPALTHLVEPASLYQSVLIYQHVTMDADSTAEARVLARLDDHQPLLVQRNVGQGSVTMLGTSAHVGWSNLPLRPIFLPMLFRMTFTMAGVDQQRRQGIAGAPLVYAFNDRMRPGAMEITPPSGSVIRQSLDEHASLDMAFYYPDTYEIGVYTLRPLESADVTAAVYAVNVDPEEADFTKVRAEELEERFGETPLVFAEDPEDLSSTFDWLRKGKSLWGPFLAAVLAVLVFECFVSNMLSPREEESNLAQISPEMRGLVRKGRA